MTQFLLKNFNQPTQTSWYLAHLATTIQLPFVRPGSFSMCYARVILTNNQFDLYYARVILTNSQFDLYYARVILTNNQFDLTLCARTLFADTESFGLMELVITWMDKNI